MTDAVLIVALLERQAPSKQAGRTTMYLNDRQVIMSRRDKLRALADNTYRDTLWLEPTYRRRLAGALSVFPSALC